MQKYNQEKIKVVADKIIELMKTEKGNWFKPFSSYTVTKDNHFISNQPFNLISGVNYSGFNSLSLGLNNILYSNKAYLTFKQAKELGGSVLKGESGTHVCYYGQTTKEDGNGESESYRFLKWYSVFNIEQTSLNADELIEKLLIKQRNRKESNLNKFNERKIPTVEELDLFVANTKASIVHNQAGRCYYSPTEDYINMSPLDSWKGNGEATATEYYYSTLFHELTHWTGHKTREDRFSKANPFFNEDYKKTYAFEELVAELGSAITSSMLGIIKTPMESHAQYLNSWIKVLEDKPTCLMKATTLAKNAFNRMVAYQEKAISKVA